MLNCPACQTQLHTVQTKQGVFVDYCDSCKGVWLDEGEIFFFTKQPKIIKNELDKGLQDTKISDRRCPKCKDHGQLTEGSFFSPNLRIDQCQKCHGLWFDDGELKTAVDLGAKKFNLSLEKSEDGAFYVQRSKTKIKDDGMEQKQRHTALKLGLSALPSLAFRSTFSFILLYGFLGFVLILVGQFSNWPSYLAPLATCALILVQFIIGPWIMDLSLSWFYTCNWVKIDELPDHLAKFVSQVCKEKNMVLPSFAIIEDMTPNAFTYGHTPNNARIVITRGLIEYLAPEELEAVVAHELGHAYHWDILVMTLASLVPILLYQIYKVIMRSNRNSSGKDKGNAVLIAAVAYILYIVSEYIVLWLSRVREYWADRFAGDVTKNPNSLSKALVKIAYGLISPKLKQNQDSKESEGKESNSLEPIQALGIFNHKDAKILALNSYPAYKQKLEESKDPGTYEESIADAMQWDLWNPWAGYYELHSTHPLPAKRINALSDQASSMQQEPYILFNRQKPESYWDEFFVDVFMYWLPTIPFLGMIAYTIYAASNRFIHRPEYLLHLGGLLAAHALFYFFRLRFSYPSNIFPKMKISSLLSKVKVSSVRAIPVTLTGTVVGRGIPGYMFSEDMVMEDESGIIFLDYRQPLSIFEFFFALFRTDTYIGKQVTVQGWYRRSPVPYIEVKSLQSAGSSSDCYVYTFKVIWCMILFVAAILCVVQGLSR